MFLQCQIPDVFMSTKLHKEFETQVCNLLMIEKRANVVRRMGILRRVAMQSGSRPMGDGVEAEIRAALNLHPTQPSPVQHAASQPLKCVQIIPKA